MVETYAIMGLVMALYVAMIVSFCFPHVLDVSLRSRVSPSIFGLMFMGSVMLSIFSSFVLHSAGSDVKRVHAVLYGLRMRLFVCVHISDKILMLTYKSYYNIAPTYLCELISRRESSVNTRLGSDQHQLIMPPISKDCSNTFLERSFIYAAPCEWNKLSECIRTSSFDSFRKSVKKCYLLNNMGDE